MSALLPRLDRRAPPQRPASAPATGAVQEAINRLEEIIDIENAALADGATVDFNDLNRRKSQSLLELTRLSRMLPVGAPPGLRQAITRLRDKLIHNHRTLGLHVAAVKDIAELMVNAMAAAESDGTYGALRSPRRDLRR